METFTNRPKDVSCFIYNANKYRQYYVKKNKMFAGIVRTKRARQELKHETELLWKKVVFNNFHCHSEKILNASTTVLRILRVRGKRQNTLWNDLRR